MPSFPDKVSWDSFRTTSLIIEYQKFEHLYNPQHELYRNKKTREETLGLIAKALNVAWKGTGITCSIDDIKKKLNGLRSQYLFERQKITRAASQGEVYSPTIYWYPMLKFLEPVTLKAPTTQVSTDVWRPGSGRYVSAFIPQFNGVINIDDDDDNLKPENEDDTTSNEGSPSTASTSTSHKSFVDIQSFLCENSVAVTIKRKAEEEPAYFPDVKHANIIPVNRNQSRNESKPEPLTNSEVTDHLETFGKFVANELRGIYLSSSDVFLRRTKRQLQQVLIDAWTQIDMDASRYPGSVEPQPSNA